MTCALGRNLRDAGAETGVAAPAVLFLRSCDSGTWIERDRVRGGVSGIVYTVAPFFHPLLFCCFLYT